MLCAARWFLQYGTECPSCRVQDNQQLQVHIGTISGAKQKLKDWVIRQEKTMEVLDHSVHVRQRNKHALVQEYSQYVHQLQQIKVDWDDAQAHLYKQGQQAQEHQTSLEYIQELDTYCNRLRDRYVRLCLDLDQLSDRLDEQKEQAGRLDEYCEDWSQEHLRQEQSLGELTTQCQRTEAIVRETEAHVQFETRRLFGIGPRISTENPHERQCRFCGFGPLLVPHVDCFSCIQTYRACNKVDRLASLLQARNVSAAGIDRIKDHYSQCSVSELDACLERCLLTK